MRFSKKQIEMIKDKFGVDRIWSFSKKSTMEQCSWLYYLKYIEKLKGIKDSCYTHWGTVAHDIIQGYYDGLYTSHEDMLEELDIQIAKYQKIIKEDKKNTLEFPNENEFESYIENLIHYFTHTELIGYNINNEKPIITKLDGKQPHVFQGFIDSIYTDENGNTYIVDYKTSSDGEFRGAKLDKKANQLYLYAHGLVNYQGYDINKLFIRYDMMKYVNITFTQKNGKDKTMRKARKDYVSFLYSKLIANFKDLEKEGELIEKEIKKLVKKQSAKCRTENEIEELQVEISNLEEKLENLVVYDMVQIDEYVEQAMAQNSLDGLPQEIKSLYKVENAYIDIPLTQESLDKQINETIEVLDYIVEREKLEDKPLAFNRGEIQEQESYFCKNLCDMRLQCKYFKEYTENVNLFKTEEDGLSDEDILAMLGI